MDKYPKDVRSRMMRSVRSKGNRSTELKLIQIFRALGYKGWRRSSQLPGKPDFIFPKERIAVFADGCYWHGHDCRSFQPGANAEYWIMKIARNKERDRAVSEVLIQRGWHVVRLWECEISERLVKRKLHLRDEKGFVGQ
ncbi:MAG: very short patch repair endonuclease [Candidatus Kapaibacterium sp.]